MDTVHVPHHVRSDDEFGDDAKLIGVYRSAEAAAAAATRLMDQPGFRDHPTGFHADAYPLDRDHWCEGFISGE
jgi:homoserine kinase type II